MVQQYGPPPSDLRPMRDSFGGTIVNVRDHGARGDDKADDTAALEAAVAALANGDALYFPAGTYRVSRPLEPRVRVLFFSLTDRAVLQASAKSGFPMFIVRAGAVEFHRLTIDCAKDQTASSADPAPAIWRPADAPAPSTSPCSTAGSGTRMVTGSVFREAPGTIAPLTAWSSATRS